MRQLQTGDPHVKHLLRVLDDHAFDSTDAWLKIQTIAAEMCAPVRTVERAIARAKAAGYLVTLRPGRFWRCAHCRAWTQRKSADCGLCRQPRSESVEWSYRNCTTFRLRRQELADAARVTQGTEQSATLAEPIRHTGGSDPPNRRMQSATLADPKKDPLKAFLKTSPKWTEAAEELISYGCDNRPSIESAIRQADERGTEPEKVLALIRFAEDHTAAGVRAWGPGGVLQRIASDQPDRAVDDVATWMRPADEYAAAARKLKARRADALLRRVEWAKQLPAEHVRDVAEFARDVLHNARLYERLDADRFRVFDDTAQPFLKAFDACKTAKSTT